MIFEKNQLGVWGFDLCSKFPGKIMPMCTLLNDARVEFAFCSHLKSGSIWSVT